jgi:DNA-binding PadR family transcriptional regulator
MGQLFKVSGALKDSLENRLRKGGYVDGTDIPNKKIDRKPIRMTLYSITPKGQKLLKGWLGFLLAMTIEYITYKIFIVIHTHGIR